MDKKLASILEESIKEIGTETGLGAPEITMNKEPGFPEFLVSIGITGNYQGYFMLRGSESVIFNLMERMISHSGLSVEIADKKEIFTEAFKEFANQISGRFMMNLSEEGINGNITPPTIIQGKNINMELSRLPIFISLKAMFSGDELHIEIGVKKS